MTINNVTVNATASKNFQKVEISISASIENENDIDTLQTLAIRKALIGINKLTGESVETPKVETTVQPAAPIKRSETPQNYQSQNPYFNNQYYNNQTQQTQNNSNTKMASEKQIALLKKCRYNLDWNTLTAEQASLYIKEALGNK